ncbi:MAG: DUF4843 domain-containing protein [Butyricimonas faecihominis]
MKRLVMILWVLAVFIGCEQKPEPYFESLSSIRFKYKKTDAVIPVEVKTINYSFGYVAENQLTDTILLEVTFTGPLVGHDRMYKVEVADSGTMVTGRTTMEVGRDYLPIAGDHVVRGGIWVDTLPVIVSREYINPGFQKKETKSLVLRLGVSDDFEKVVEGMNEIQITVNNYLGEPSWWGRDLNFYHPEKYKILMTLQPLLSNPDKLEITGLELQALGGVLATYLNENVVLDPETQQRIFMDRMEVYLPEE